MTDEMAAAPDSPREVLAGLGDLNRKVLAAQRGAWFPLLLFGVLTVGGILVDHATFNARAVPCPAGHGPGGVATDCVLTRQGSAVFWSLGHLLAYATIAFFYLRRSRGRGVGTQIRPYVLCGIGIAVLFGVTAFWANAHLSTPPATIDFWGLRLQPGAGLTMVLERFTGEAVSVGVPLLVLSWVERSRALLLFALAFLVIELTPIGTGWPPIPPSSTWSGLSNLAIPAVFLLLGALGFALTQLPRRRSAS
jgi:hypothetical protein